MRALASHTAAYTFAQLASRGTVLVWLLVLPSFLSAADYGALGLIVTVAALVNLVVPLEISQGLARYYPSAEPPRKRAYVATAWTFTLLMLALAASAALIFARPACLFLLGDLRYLPVFRMAVLFFILNTIFYFLQSQFRWDFRPRDYTVATLIFAVVTLSASVAFAALFEDPLLGVLVGQFLGVGAGVVIGIVMLNRTLALGISNPSLKVMLRFSLPLVPASIALFLSSYASRFIVADLLDLRQVGIFVWASQLASIPALLLLGIQGALTPLVMKHHGDADTKVVLARTFETVVAAELLLCLGLGAFTPELVALLGYSQFAGAGVLVLMLAPAMLLLQLYVFAPGFAIAERTDLQLLVSIAAAIAAVAFNYVLIGPLGLLGAAAATLLASTFFLGCWLALSQRLYPLPVRWSRLAILVLAAVGAGVAIASLALPALAIAIAVKALLIGAFAATALLLGLVQTGDWTVLPARPSGGRGE